MKNLFFSLALSLCAMTSFAQSEALVSFESLEDKAIEEVCTFGDDRAYFISSKVKLSSVNGKVSDKVNPANVDFYMVVVPDYLRMPDVLNGGTIHEKNTDRIPTGFYHVTFDSNGTPITDEDFGDFSYHKEAVEEKYGTYKMFSKPITTLTKAITQISNKFDLSKVDRTLVVQYNAAIDKGISFNIGVLDGSEPSYYKYIPLNGSLEYIDYEEVMGD